jgi:hypothetical protein
MDKEITFDGDRVLFNGRHVATLEGGQAVDENGDTQFTYELLNGASAAEHRGHSRGYWEAIFKIADGDPLAIDQLKNAFELGNRGGREIQ